jgi:hypothetical protein
MRGLMFLVPVVALAGCPSESPPACTTVALDCAPQYVPTFDNVYANKLRTDCGSTRGGCHAVGGVGEIAFADPAAAHAALEARKTTGSTLLMP